jgi:hypothetical protein
MVNNEHHSLDCRCWLARYHGPSTWDQLICALTPLVEVGAANSTLGSAMLRERRPRCG